MKTILFRVCDFSEQFTRGADLKPPLPYDTYRVTAIVDGERVEHRTALQRGMPPPPVEYLRRDAFLKLFDFVANRR